MKNSELSDQAFLNRISAEAQTPAFARFSEQSNIRQHPTADLLHDYAAGELGETLAPALRAHLAFCRECAREALRLMQVADELEHDALDWADSPKRPLSEHFDVAVAAAKTLRERSRLWLSELWQPQWAGQLVTAADVPEQHHTFASEHGDIRLTCHWQDDLPNEPAILLIGWQADLMENDRLWLRFVNPSDKALRQEIFLGSRAVGEEQFTIQDLTFDFVREQWAISLALEVSSS